MQSTIRLFKAVPIRLKLNEMDTNEAREIDIANLRGCLTRLTIKSGFIFAPEVIYNYSENELLELIRKVEKEVGLSGKQMNASFHKSWCKVRDADIVELVIEQMMHYITTYGYERLGIYDKDTVYIPSEELKIPKLKENIPLTIIRGYTKEELKSKLLKLLECGVALAEDTIKDVVDVALFVEINEKEIEQIRNNEARVILFDYLDKIPETPVEFLRLIVYKATGKTLLIINEETIQAIREKQGIDTLKYLNKYRREHGLERLAEIFFRFKPLFLAFRTSTQTKTIVNKIRKLAATHHKPMESDYLNSVTASLARGEKIDAEQLKHNLSKVNAFRKIRLAYALKFRAKEGVDSILYRVRNGKSYATSFTFDHKGEASRVLSIVLESIVSDVRRNVEGKKIFLPKNIVYALPATEKQFTGDLPSGSYVTMPKDMVFGVHWANVDGERVDLDLSVISATKGKVGWDACYRSEVRNILFSGDVTDAPLPNGASELFYLAKQTDNTLIMFVNYYNSQESGDVPFKILVANEPAKALERNYTVNPNNIVCIAKTKIAASQPQKILGLVVTTPKECRFYFCETGIGKSITSSDNKYAGRARKYLFDFYTNTINLGEILTQAGAELVNERDGADIDLSVESLEKDKIIKLFA